MSSIQSQASATPEVESAAISPGSRLRQARERRGESVSEVAFALKLNPRQVAALESDDFAALPGMAFVRGFMRNYARYLGLDPAPLLDEVRRLSGGGAVDLTPIRNAEGEMPNGSGSKVRTAPIGWIVLALLLMVLVGWYFDWFQTEPSVAETTLEAPVMGGVRVEPALPPATMAPSAVTPPTAAEPAPAAASEVPATGDPAAGDPATAVPAGSPAADAAPSEPAPPAAGAADASVAQTDSSASEAGSAGAEPAPVPSAGNGVLAFRFNGESWIEVRDAGGSVVYSGINRAGATRNVQGRPPFALVVGNAANVSLEFDGRPVDLAAHTKVSVARLTVQ
ncbi:RodZ domain-containing protein [Thauera sp. SDU_THAU2]|uniref:RodZ domain-containing protein n=1 Tax=Thauera sp. SDU_THAU2 TaxID=3136633 RepID=UPI00311F3872